MTENTRLPDGVEFERASPDGTGSSASRSEALVVVGHGSHLNPRSAEPAYDHADVLRDRGIFDEVRVAFWKEEPSLREVLRTVESDVAVVVPLFMAAGYFTERVVPRELRVTDDWTLDADVSVRYADPVGTHDAMTAVVVERAERITGERNLDEGFGLAVVGHGTERNENSAKAARHHAARIRERGRFEEVHALFMDEPPAVEDVTSHFETDDVVAVPLFVADGYHTQEDIPEDVGLTDDYRDGYDVPAEVEGHRIWYAGAVGTEPLMADVVLERARDAVADPAGEDSVADLTDGSRSAPEGADDGRADHRRAFLRWVDEALENGATRTWGELAITTSGSATGDAEGGFIYELRHEEDRTADLGDLETHDRPRDLRDLARFDAKGDFRPLRTAPTLPDGWRLSGLDGEELVRAVEFAYPATVVNWHREREGDLDVTHFRSTAERQTGIYERVADLDREAVDRAAAACCADETCLKRRAWDYDEDESLDAPRGDGEFPCREPCSLFVAAAREFERIERELDRTDVGEPAVGDDLDLVPGDPDDLESALDDVADGRAAAARVGGVSDPANQLRARYLRARLSGDDGTVLRAATAEGPR
jgi:sirohydrochlorin cobaltochelatase